MTLKIARLTKTALALIARIWFLSGVNSQVLAKRRFISETVTTRLALVDAGHVIGAVTPPVSQ